MITSTEFFQSVHLNSYVCCLDRETKAQFNGLKVDERYTDIKSLFSVHFLPFNQQGHGVHYTVNGVKKEEDKNRKTNFDILNGWLLEIDIEETKNIDDDFALLDTREKRKEVIRGKIFMLDQEMWPSLMVETRNGFQITWWAKDGSFENYDQIINGLWQKFKDIGADRSGMNYWSMFRVPYFKYNKNGETGVVQPFEWLSSLKLFSEQEMLEFLQEDIKNFTSVKKTEEIKVSIVNNLFKSRPITLNQFGITKEPRLTSILKHPVVEFLGLLSGTEAVRGDFIFLTPIINDKQQIHVNNKPSPNWVDLEKNMIFSNNSKGMNSIVHYLEYYGHSKKESINILWGLLTGESSNKSK